MTVQRRIEGVINVFESGSVIGDYGLVSIYPDGKKGTKQITYGRSQTTEQGNLKELIEMYCNAKDAKYSQLFAPFLKSIGVKPLYKNAKFLQALKNASFDPVMMDTQDAFFDKRYFQPSQKWAVDNGFKFPLSHLVIYDSFVHSGSVPMFLRRLFKEYTPANGGDEKNWVISYLRVRRDWLISKGVPLSKTVYRIDCFEQAIKEDNWLLEKEVNANKIIV